jgi:hypothetical protein
LRIYRYIQSIHQLTIQSEDALVTCMDETRHGLEDGDYVTFTEVKGMDGLNSAEPRKITTKGQLALPT